MSDPAQSGKRKLIVLFIVIEIAVMLFIGTSTVMAPQITPVLELGVTTTSHSIDKAVDSPAESLIYSRAATGYIVDVMSESMFRGPYDQSDSEVKGSNEDVPPEEVNYDRLGSREAVLSAPLAENNMQDKIRYKAVHEGHTPPVAFMGSSNVMTERLDDDGLPYYKEIAIGTDPTVADTTGDGFTDGYAYRTDGLSATQMNVLIQVSYTDRVDPEVLREAGPYIERVMGANVIEHPTGDTGFNIKYVVDDEPYSLDKEEVLLSEYNDKYVEDTFTKRGYGYYHVFVVPQASLESGNIGGAAKSYGMMISDRRSGQKQAHLILHELGHLMGLGPWDYRGVDSKEVEWDEYRSIMSYVSPPCLSQLGCTILERSVFSAKGEFHDWAYMHDQYAIHAADRSKLPRDQQIYVKRSNPKLVKLDDIESQDSSVEDNEEETESDTD